MNMKSLEWWLDRVGVVLMGVAVVGLALKPIPTLAVLASVGAFAAGTKALFPQLQKLADYTTSRADNDFLLWLGPRIDTLIGVLDLLRRMPRVTMGPSLRTQPLATATGRPTFPSMQPSVVPTLAPPPPIGTAPQPWPEPVVLTVAPPVVVVPDNKEPPK